MAFYEFTEPAQQQFQHLEPWLGEETLDELESLAANPPIARLRSATGFVFDFVRIQGAIAFYVFLTIAPDQSAQRLRITSVGSYERK